MYGLSAAGGIAFIIKANTSQSIVSGPDPIRVTTHVAFPFEGPVKLFPDAYAVPPIDSVGDTPDRVANATSSNSPSNIACITLGAFVPNPVSRRLPSTVMSHDRIAGTTSRHLPDSVDAAFMKSTATLRVHVDSQAKKSPLSVMPVSAPGTGPS